MSPTDPVSSRDQTAPTSRARPLTRPLRLDLETFSRAASLHPDLARRFVTLGLLEATPGEAGELWFSPTQLAVAARLCRLRAGLGVNYAALGLVVDLLDRITELEAALRSRPRPSGGPPWTPND
jgi:chaperone modulatory protein CbpM